MFKSVLRGHTGSILGQIGHEVGRTITTNDCPGMAVQKWTSELGDMKGLVGN